MVERDRVGAYITEYSQVGSPEEVPPKQQPRAMHIWSGVPLVVRRAGAKALRWQAPGLIVAGAADWTLLPVPSFVLEGLC